jgi:hypothetical protein
VHRAGRAVVSSFALQLGDGRAYEVAGVLAAGRVAGAQVAGTGFESARGAGSVTGDLGMQGLAAAVGDRFCGDEAIAEGEADEQVQNEPSVREPMVGVAR